ncbi:MAG: hypothetical protein IKW00_09900 [Clostridia bacterium]|nr:hypothetical protein [Clostridia bacterium]
MRKVCMILILSACLLLCASACAETYDFSSIYMLLDVPNGVYETQWTPETLEQNAASVEAKGYTVAEMEQMFYEQGILLMAFDEDKDRVFVVSAVQDEQSKTLFNINDQTAAVRADYRKNHSNGTYMGSLGYKFESCEWKNFGEDQGRFLMLKYVLRNDGKVVHKGLLRRTVRNGYTITLDMRSIGRNVSSSDITALNKIQNTVSFKTGAATPEAPLTLTFTAPPPAVTNDADFTIKGTTRAGAEVRAAFYSFRNSSKATVVTTTADSKGVFKLEVTLPAQDLYNGIVTSTVNEGKENEAVAEEVFSIEYDEEMLPISFTNDFPEEFTGDSFKYTGTTLTGVTIQLNVNGENTTKKTGNNRTFSFNVNTSKEGTYKIQVTFTKKNYDTRIINYVIERPMSEEDRKAYVRETAKAPAYGELSSKTDKYIGKVVRYKGYITDMKEVGGEWVLTFATQKNGAKYGNIIMVTTEGEITHELGTQLTMYGTVDGQYYTYVDEKNSLVNPRVELIFFE